MRSIAMKAVALALCSALFFTLTYVLNRAVVSQGGHWAPACAGATVRGLEMPRQHRIGVLRYFPGQQWACAGMTMRDADRSG